MPVRLPVESWMTLVSRSPVAPERHNPAEAPERHDRPDRNRARNVLARLEAHPEQHMMLPEKNTMGVPRARVLRNHSGPNFGISLIFEIFPGGKTP